MDTYARTFDDRNAPRPNGSLHDVFRWRTRLAGFLLVVPGLLGSGRAQVPEGTVVIGTVATPGTAGTTGLFLAPLAGGPLTPITGLPASLQVASPTSGPYTEGVASVSYRSSDGALIVATASAAGGASQGAVDLFVLHLNGTAVDPARTRRITLGVTTNIGGAWNVVLPDDRILVLAGDAVGALQSGPMAGHLAAIVDTSAPNPTFTLLPDPPGLGLGGGIAVDPTGGFVYYLLTTDVNTTQRVAHLHRYDLATYQTCAITSWPGEVAVGLTCDDDGTVYVSSVDPGSFRHFVHAVLPDGCNTPASSTTTQSSVPLLPSGIDLDRESGRFVAAGGSRPGFTGPQVNAVSLIDPVTGQVTVLASPPSGGWGLVTRQAVAVNNAIESYGPRSDAGNHYGFENFPNPGGQPRVGAGGFSLTTCSAPGVPSASALVLSLDRAVTNLLGVELLVDLTTAILVPIGTASSVEIALPIPNEPALSGHSVHAQSLHVEASGGLAASRGLVVTLR